MKMKPKLPEKISGLVFSEVATITRSPERDQGEEDDDDVGAGEAWRVRLVSLIVPLPGQPARMQIPRLPEQDQGQGEQENEDQQQVGERGGPAELLADKGGFVDVEGEDFG